MTQGQNLSSVHSRVAVRGNIDTYSYAYEVMLASDVSYSDATGIAAKHMKDGVFDFQAFRDDWLYQKNLIIVQEIAQKHMKVNDLEQQPQLRDALLEALQRERNPA